MNIDQPEQDIPIENFIIPTPRKSIRVSRPLERYNFFHKHAIHVDDPTKFEKALCNKDSSRWLEGMRT